MAESKTDTAESRTAVGEPAAPARRTRAEGHRAPDGITVTRWTLGISLSIALTVLTGAFTLVWDETTTVGEMQVQLVDRVSRVEVQVGELREDVADLRGELRESVADLRGEAADLRGELRESVADLRGEIRELGDLIRARETSGVGTQ